MLEEGKAMREGRNSRRCLVDSDNGEGRRNGVSGENERRPVLRAMSLGETLSTRIVDDG